MKTQKVVRLSMECIADSTRRVSPYKPLHMQSSPPTVLTRPHTEIQTPYVSITGRHTFQN